MNLELLTLITDKIEIASMVSGAHKPSTWRTKVKNEYCVFSRIKSIRYAKIHHENGEAYDHRIRYDWKELLGPGQKEEIPCGIQDEVGNWHWPIDKGHYVHLWHPSNQDFQEALSWTKIHWRPVYDYISEEVIEALKTLCNTFDYEFSCEPDGQWFTQSCGHGGITLSL